MECLTMMQKVCVRSGLVESGEVQNWLQAPKYFQARMMFLEKLDGRLDERTSIDEQQLRQVLHGQLCRRLQALP
jgi:hypothetical protein